LGRAPTAAQQVQPRLVQLAAAKEVGRQPQPGLPCLTVPLMHWLVNMSTTLLFCF
jgi:hypothetical protein